MKSFFAPLLVVLALTIAACSSDSGGGSESVASATLLTFDADGGTIIRRGNGRSFDLSLTGVSADAVAFSDRPVRDASLARVEDVVAEWSANGWGASPPAALLTVRDGNGGIWVEAFQLGSPRYERGTLSFAVESLDDVVSTPEAFVDADLFVQPPGTAVEGGRVFSLPGTSGSFVAKTGSGAKSWTLTIADVSPIAAYLWTGTAPAAGPMQTAAFVDAWQSFGFDAVPPNASITVRNQGATTVSVLTLSDPVYDAEAATLRFTAADVAGAEDLPSSFAESDLFIDSAGSNAVKSTAFVKLIGIDYDPEARCSDDNWTTTTPAACNPQPSFSCDNSGNLDFCPTRCQACFDADLTTIQGLGVGAITIYNPNYYALKASQAQSMKVLLGTFDDTLAGLAAPDATSGCTYGGFPTACGSTYANYLIDGACGSTSPWDPLTFCSGSGNTFIAPWKPVLEDGTVIGIQIGNEVISNGYTLDQITSAAQTLRGVLDARGYTADKVPIVISLVLGNESQVCSNGAPPANVDFIAAHPYCNNVAGTPPSWPATAADCVTQVETDFTTISQAQCGTANVFIGETGFNTGCPGVYGSTYVADATTFVGDVTKWACSNSYGLFHFAFVDACPSGGCLAGCASQPTEGNGYFGLYSTEDYLTKGALVPKLTPMPSLICPTPTP